MRNLLLVAWLLIVHAQAYGALPSTVRVTAVDALNGKVLSGPIVAGATETAYMSDVVSHTSSCFRAGATQSAGGSALVKLPAATMGPGLWVDSRSIHVFVFGKGYCAARPYAQVGDDRGGVQVRPVAPGGEVTVPMTRSEDDSERRLRHLALVAKRLQFCSGAGPAFIEPLKAAINAEAREIARTPYEKELAEAVELAWAQPIRYRLVDPNAQPSPNSRGMDGLTPLMRAATNMQFEVVTRLLEQGGRADLVTGSDGYSALDLVLSRAAKDVKEGGTEGQEIHMLRMIKTLVAASPPPSLRGDYRATLDDPSKWTITPHLREFWMQVRQQVQQVGARPIQRSSCTIEEPALRELPLTARATR